MNSPAMSRDADLLRRLVFALERIERSPPEPFPLALPELAATVGMPHTSLEAALDELAALTLIEGPGRLAGMWWFRRLTARGRVFADENARGEAVARDQRRIRRGWPLTRHAAPARRRAASSFRARNPWRSSNSHSLR